MHRVKFKAKNGTTYVYEGTTVWDDEEKKYRTKRICIGKIDPATGDLVPSKRLNMPEKIVQDINKNRLTVTHAGHDMLLWSITKALKLDTVLKNAVPSDWRAVLAMVWYLVVENEPLSACGNWLPFNRTPFIGKLDSRYIVEILDRLHEDARERFYRQWGTLSTDTSRMLYDLRSVASYNACYPSLAWGVNMEGNSPRQLRYVMVAGKNSMLPLYLESTDTELRTIGQVSELLRTLRQRGVCVETLNMDQEFYSIENITAMFARRYSFLQAIRIQDAWIRNLIERNRDMTGDPASLYLLDGRNYYARTIEYTWEEEKKARIVRHPCTVHLFYSQDIIGKDRDRFMYRIQQERERLEQHQEDIPEADLAKFFVFGQHKYTGRRTVGLDMEELERHEKAYAGFFAFLTNDPQLKDPVKVLESHRMQRTIERSFDDLRNDLDLLRIRIHESNRIAPRLFVQFIASIYICALRKQLQDTGLDNDYTYKEILAQLKNICVMSNKEHSHESVMPMNETQRKLVEILLPGTRIVDDGAARE